MAVAQVPRAVVHPLIPHPCMETLKHECGVAMIRLLKPLEYYRKKYGSYTYALDRLYLLMEKQHNRGQEAAGIGVVKLHRQPGNEYIFRERALGSGAISEIFDNVHRQQPEGLNGLDPETVESRVPMIGEIYMGHLRYSTTGRAGMSYVHPFLRRNNWPSRNLLMCGNFNMTNVDRIFRDIVAQGQHPRLYSDTIVLLEQLGYALDKENHRLYREHRNTLTGHALDMAIEDNIDLTRMLQGVAGTWDGGYVICGATGSGDMFALRDPHGIRPAFYYHDDEVVVVASERPVIQTVMNVRRVAISELMPGQALMVTKSGGFSVRRVLTEKENSRCSFERIYFSRGSDADIYRERKELGHSLAAPLVEMLDNDLENTVFSFIPNTAEVAFLGLTEALNGILEKQKADELISLRDSGCLTEKAIKDILSRGLRIEKVALKDIKLRTFIAEGTSRNDLAAHVYDVTYGCIKNNVDTLVVIDDSIVRGTTLRQSILTMLDRLHPRRIIVVSSSPQVRYPDCYGIDMSRLSEFIAFRAAIELFRIRGMEDKLEEIYLSAKHELTLPETRRTNVVKDVYAPFTDSEISRQMAVMLTPPEVNADVDLLFQSVEGLHRAVPGHPGDWYFSGNYPTPGGTTVCLKAFVDYYEGKADKRPVD